MGPWAITYTQTNYIDTLLYHVYESWDMCHICNGPFCVANVTFIQGNIFGYTLQSGLPPTAIHPSKAVSHPRPYISTEISTNFRKKILKKIRKKKKNFKWQFNGRSPKFEATLKGLIKQTPNSFV